MHRVPVGVAIFFLVVQIFVYFGNDSCGPNCVIDKESLGYTILLNIAFLVYAIYKNIKNRKNRMW